MTPVGLDGSAWFLQQDYFTFLAVLGWLTAGLIAWGESASEPDPRSLPLKWFAGFCVLMSLDATLDLAKMIAPHVWPREINAVLRLASYGYLCEFARRTAFRRRWFRAPGWLSFLIPGAAQTVLIFFPGASPYPEFVVGTVAGLGAAAAMVAGVERRARALLGVAAVLPFLGPGELLRGGGEVAIEGLYGLLVTGEGMAAALGAAVLAWVATAGLWLHGVLRQRTGLFAGRPEAFSPVVAIVLPAILAATLAGGMFLVNWSAQRARGAVERQYIELVRTAALSIEPGMVSRSLRFGENDAAMSSYQRVRRQVRAIDSISDQVLRAYLWNVVDERIVLPKGLVAGRDDGPEEAAIVRLGMQALTSTTKAHLLGPLTNRGLPLLIANAPILDTSTRTHLAWLGVDLSATDWLMAQALARLQTIALVGLFASLLVFFLAHMMLREHEAELLIGKERAEAADRAKDEFLAVMSHEIRTPMHSVLGYSELMARTPLNDAQTGYLDTIRSQGRTLLRIVQDILDFSTLRKSSYTLKSESVYLQRIVEMAHDSLRPFAARKKLRFEFTIANDVPETVRGDGVRIEQILLNLLNNSVKFTDHGSVQLDVTLERIETDGREQIHWVLFSISDTGMGIRPEDVRKLFQPFMRLSAGDNVPREGTGLGLAIVKRLCQLMGGSVELTSDWGRGTRFFVRVPFVSASPAPNLERTAPDEAQSPAPDAEPSLVDLGAILPLRILVADDNPFVRRLLMEYLHSIGYAPTETASGVEPASRWREFDLLIMDLRMPGMDGITAAEKIRAASGHDTEPWIIGVSATLAEAEIERAMKAGMNDFLGKPFFVQSLIEAIQASPLSARQTAEPPPKKSEPARRDDAARPAGGMSWMPDLSAAGHNEIVAEALAEIPRVLDEIEHALREGSLEAAGERAHYLKNTVFALHIEPMTDPCRALMEHAAGGDLAAASQSFKSLRAAFVQWKAKGEPAGDAPGAKG